MNKADAIQSASTVLNQLLVTQPNLLKYDKGSQPNGADAADFCIKFIETYSAWLEKQG